MDIWQVLNRILVCQFSKRLCQNSFTDLFFMLAVCKPSKGTDMVYNTVTKDRENGYLQSNTICT